VGLECCADHVPAVAAYLGEFYEPGVVDLQESDWRALARQWVEDLQHQGTDAHLISLDRPLVRPSRAVRRAARAG
jgi:hypothetical protein